MFEVIAIWDGQFYMHQCLDAKEAKEWAECYHGHENCKIRIWQMF